MTTHSTADGLPRFSLSLDLDALIEAMRLDELDRIASGESLPAGPRLAPQDEV